MRVKSLAFAVFVLLIALGACSQTTPSPTPSPSATVALPTSTPVVSTPTPTTTPVPPTPTPLPSPTPTPVVDPDTLPLLNEEQVTVPQDWLIFTSPTNGFQLSYPSEWLAMDLTQDDWQTILNNVTDASLRNLLTEQVQALIKSNTLAFLTYPLSESGEQRLPFASNLNILRTSVPQETSQTLLVQAIIQNLKNMSGLRLESMNRGKVGEYPAVAILYSYPIRSEDEKIYHVVGWQVYLRTQPEEVYVLTFTTLADVLPERIKDFARMANSFHLVRENGQGK